MKAPLYIKLILNKFVCFSSINCFCQFVVDPAGDIKKVEENFPPLHYSVNLYIFVNQIFNKYVLNIHHILGKHSSYWGYKVLVLTELKSL